MGSIGLVLAVIYLVYPQAGVGINIIENLGSSFGAAMIATVVATVIQEFQPTVANSLKGYHAGFFVSVVILAVIFIPSLFLTHRKGTSSEGFRT